MCPSFRVTHDEQHLTRGRANTLRLAMSGQLGEGAMSSDAMHETMQLCVSCKACRRECPTGVDMAKMKIEVMAARARIHGHSLHHRLVAHMPRYASAASRLRGVLNLRNRIPAVAKLTESLSGFSSLRNLPVWSSQPFRENDTVGVGNKNVVLLADTFNTWFEPENLRAARVVLQAAGYRVHLAQQPGERKLCCGRTYLATGMVDQARQEAQRMVDALLPWAHRGVPIVGLEPSCLLSLRDEYKVLLPGAETALLAEHALLLEELIMRDHDAGRLDWNLSAPAGKVLVHGHCHQKALGAFSAVQRALALVPDMEVVVIDSSCCGMAGAFGYGRDTAAVSLQMAELSLLPAVRSAETETLVVADGTSCRHQIADGAQRGAIHVVQVLAMALQAAGSAAALAQQSGYTATSPVRSPS